MKKLVAILLVVVLCCTVSIGLTLAYLTDRDSEANIFTVGNVSIDLTEDFEQGATLTPGVDIEKVPKITNTGENDAWVWMTIAIPSALDTWTPGSVEGSMTNIIHWNFLGATADGYVNDTRVEKAIADGYLPEGTTAQAMLDNKTTWDVVNGLEYTQEIDGVQYNVYTLRYNKVLAPEETTLPSLVKVYMDANVDIDTDGQWNIVENGVITKLDWNTNDDGAPVIYVSAYAMQAEGFDTVAEAYEAYQAQWGDKGEEFVPPTTVSVTPNP